MYINGEQIDYGKSLFNQLGTKDGVATLDMIVEEVAEETQFSKREVMDMYRHTINYIKSEMEKEDVFSIRIPFFGVMTYNYKYSMREFKGSNRNKKRSLWKQKQQKVKEFLEDNLTNKATNKKPVLMQYGRVISMDYKTKYKTRKLQPFKQSIDLIENYSKAGYELKDNWKGKKRPSPWEN